MMRDECPLCGTPQHRGFHGQCACIGHEYEFDGGHGAGWQCKHCFETPPVEWIREQERGDPESERAS